MGWCLWVGLAACSDDKGQVPTKITLDPASPELAAGTTLEVAATYVNVDRTSAKASDATWSVGDAAVATVAPGKDGHATVRGVSAGTTMLTVSGQGVTATFPVTVSPAVLMSLAVTPPVPSFAAGTSLQLTATGTYSDATTRNLSEMVDWSSSAVEIATIDATGLLHGVEAGQATVTATLNGTRGTVSATVTPATLSAIEVTPLDPKLPLGVQQQLTATGVFSDRSTQDLTTQVTWTSDAADHAAVSSAGVVTATGLGGATITAALAGVAGTSRVTVTAAVLASIAIEPPSPSLARGRTLQLAATGIFTDATVMDLTNQVVWAAASPDIASVSDTGLLTARELGTSTLTATMGTAPGAFTASTVATVTAAEIVSIAVTPAASSLPLGRTVQFTATGTFSDATVQDVTTQVAWSSSAGAIAAVSNADGSRGVATAIAVGQTMIAATAGAVTGSTTLTATAAELVAIEVAPLDASLPLGRTLSYTATGRYSDNTTLDVTTQVTWASSAPDIAAISNATGSAGVATARATGATTVRASVGAITGQAALTVTPAVIDRVDVMPTDPSLARGLTLQLTATAVFSDLTTQDVTTQVAWTSSAPAIAAIANAAGSAGLATALEVGTTTITASLTGATGSTRLTVTPAVLATIQVTPVNPTIPAAILRGFTATGILTDATTQDLTAQVAWASSNEAVATVSNADPTRGVATGVGPGTTMIRATLGGMTGSTTLTVSDATLVSLQLTPIAPSLAKGRSLQFTATGTFSDATTQDLTAQVLWSSSDETIAALSNAAASKGQAMALAVGPATITATFAGITGATPLTVTAAALDSIAIAPADASIAAGRHQAFTAMGTFSDATTQDLTSQVTWTSSDEAIATISNAAGSNGQATGLTAGTATITATLLGVTSSTTLTVTAAVLDAITVAPADASVAKGRTQQYTATGLLSDGTTSDLTTQVTWASSADAVAQISNAAGSSGLAMAVDIGTATITATLTGVTGATSLTVTAAVLDAITVTPATGIVGPGGTRQFTATGTFSDATIADLTTQVTWATGDSTIAQISNADPTRGLATGLAVGTTTVTATLLTVTGSAAINVVAPPVVASTLPRDGTTGIRGSTPIVVTFDQPIAPATLTTQTTAGPCTGTLQLSGDGFATCVGFTGAPVLATNNTVATATPSAALQVPASYRIRVLGSVTSADALPLGATFTQATGFTTAAPGTCWSSLVISQVYGGGGNNLAVLSNDFIELYNRGAQPVDLTGYAVQFATGGATAPWNVQALPPIVVPPGGYFLIQEAAGTRTGLTFPIADFVPTNPFMMGATSGKVALTPSTTPLSGACPIGLSNDFVGYGNGVSCFEGTASTAAPSATNSVLRVGGGCTDTDDNKADFTAATAAPRNSATALAVCACFL